ncbi:MAG: hypothetical protein KKA81_17345, partial [Bacteroidetes bacterium]|nr:hypothetical protein [Bacteroidota bacterium]
MGFSLKKLLKMPKKPFKSWLRTATKVLPLLAIPGVGGLLGKAGGLLGGTFGKFLGGAAKVSGALGKYAPVLGALQSARASREYEKQTGRAAGTIGGVGEAARAAATEAAGRGQARIEEQLKAGRGLADWRERMVGEIKGAGTTAGSALRRASERAAGGLTYLAPEFEQKTVKAAEDYAAAMRYAAQIADPQERAAAEDYALKVKEAATKYGTEFRGATGKAGADVRAIAERTGLPAAKALEELYPQMFSEVQRGPSTALSPGVAAAQRVTEAQLAEDAAREAKMAAFTQGRYSPARGAAAAAKVRAAARKSLAESRAGYAVTGEEQGRATWQAKLGGYETVARLTQPEVAALREATKIAADYAVMGAREAGGTELEASQNAALAMKNALDKVAQRGFDIAAVNSWKLFEARNEAARTGVDLGRLAVEYNFNAAEKAALKAYEAEERALTTGLTSAQAQYETELGAAQRIAELGLQGAQIGGGYGLQGAIGAGAISAPAALETAKGKGQLWGGIFEAAMAGLGKKRPVKNTPIRSSFPTVPLTGPA